METDEVTSLEGPKQSSPQRCAYGKFRTFYTSLIGDFHKDWIRSGNFNISFDF